jgi:hypothetical protein
MGKLIESEKENWGMGEWEIGIMDCWNIGWLGDEPPHYSNIPTIHSSNIPILLVFQI